MRRQLWHMIARLKKGALALLHLVYPRHCLYCHWDLLHFEEVLCTHCQRELPKTFPFLVHPQLQKVFFGRCDFHALIVGFKMEKTGMMRELLHALKYKQHPEVGVVLAQLWAKNWLRNMQQCPWDCIVPVPLHPKKMRKRGYNQALEIAKGLSQEWQIPVVENWLVRTTQGKSQTFKNRWIRNNKLDNPFDLVSLQCPNGNRVLLIDDVVTTGATLIQCCEVLQKAQGIQISLGALAMPVHNRIVV